MAKPQQRRGKNEKAAANATKTTTTEVFNSVDVQIQKAQVAVAKGRATAAELHSQWRQHLLRLSYMVVLICLHQWQTPITDCLYDVKSYNKSLTPLDDDSLRVSGFKAMYYVLNDTFCEFLGFVMGILLTLFLTQQYEKASVTLVNASSNTAPLPVTDDSFITNKLYMISTGLVPPMVNLYFVHNKKKKAQSAPSCLDAYPFAQMGGAVWEHHAVTNATVRGFPVVIVFHIIATASCWFMDMQHRQHNKNIIALENLRKELTQKPPQPTKGKQQSTATTTNNKKKS